MPKRSRDDFVRQLWIADFEFKEDLPHAHLFVRASDGAEVLVPKREHVGAKWAGARLHARHASDLRRFASPCCNGESVMRLVFGGAMYLRCTVCEYLWSKPASARPELRVVK